MKKFYLAGKFLPNAMPSFIQIMMVLLSDGVLLTIEKVRLTVVRPVWIMPEMPNQVKTNAIYGFIAHQRPVAIPRISMSTNIRSAGSNM